VPVVQPQDSLKQAVEVPLMPELTRITRLESGSMMGL